MSEPKLSYKVKAKYIWLLMYARLLGHDTESTYTFIRNEIKRDNPQKGERLFLKRNCPEEWAELRANEKEELKRELKGE